jgi:hypothetical protein
MMLWLWLSWPWAMTHCRLDLYICTVGIRPYEYSIGVRD